MKPLKLPKNHSGDRENKRGGKLFGSLVYKKTQENQLEQVEGGGLEVGSRSVRTWEQNASQILGSDLMLSRSRCKEDEKWRGGIFMNISLPHL